MNKIQIVVVFCVFFSIKVKGQITSLEQNWQHEFKFNRKVKSIREIEYNAVDSFGILKKTGKIKLYDVLMGDDNIPIEIIGPESEINLVEDIGKVELDNNLENILVKNVKYGFEYKKSKLSTDYISYKEGKIKKENWKYDLNRNIVEYNSIENDTLITKEIAVYNNKNKLSEYKKYDQNGKLTDYIAYTYDIRGNNIEKLKFNSYGYHDHKKFNYNQSNQEVESFSLDKSEKIISKSTSKYKFSKSGKISERVVNYIWDNDSKFNSKYVYKYSNSGKITSVDSYNYLGFMEGRETFKYDSKDRLIFKDGYFGKKIYFYDLSGNLLEENISYSENGVIKSKYITKYEYDSKGNWIKKIYSNIKTPNLIPENYIITERIITYK